jgi:hypothetical protein
VQRTLISDCPKLSVFSVCRSIEAVAVGWHRSISIGKPRVVSVKRSPNVAGMRVCVKIVQYLVASRRAPAVVALESFRYISRSARFGR